MKQIFIFFVAAICCMNAWAEDFSWEGIYYRILSEKNKKVEVTFFGDSYDDHREYSGTVDIPEETYYCGDYYRVTSIGKYAFSGCTSLRSVTIPNSVTNIANSAFTGCTGLSSVTIGNGITQIGSALFRGCTSLHSITIPNSVTSIGEYAFFGCTSLRSVTIPNSVTSIGRDAFFGCSGLTSVTIPESVTSIGESAFEDCSSLPSVTIPNGVTCIKDGTFMGCTSLKLVTIGNSVTSIENKAFNRCGLTSVTIPNSVTSIGDEVFRGCAGLSSVTIGNSITSIGKDAFTACSSLKSVVWNAKTISNFALTDDYYHDLPPFHSICSQITSFTFGEKVKRIPAYLCYEMRNLKSVTISNSVTSIGKEAFSGCKSLTSVTIPNSVTSIGDYAFYVCSKLTSVTIPNSVTSIGSSTFSGCSSLTSVTIGNSVTSIGYGTFDGCSSLTSVTIPNSVTSIGDRAFNGCHQLKSITIPSSVTSIGNYAFTNCNRLTSITIPNSVTSIGEYAFADCSSLTSVTIGKSVTSIGRIAFDGCKSLTSITCKATTPPTVGSSAFYRVSKSISVHVPCGCVEAYKAANGWKDFTNIQEPLAEYSIELDVNGSIMGCAKVDKNTACGNQISATANYGYHFVHWSDGNTDNPRTLTLTQDTVLTAEFAINQYTIATVSSDTQRGTTQGDTTVNYLEYITISATANYGYHFSHWNDYNYDNPRQVQVTKDMTYTATFDKNTYAISLSCNEEQGSVEGVTSAEYLDTVTILATANYGYHFAQWSDGVKDNPRTITVTGDAEYTALFRSTEGFENIYTSEPVQKVIIDQKVYILRGEKVYTVTGQEVQ